MKAYREYLQSADRRFLDEYWDRIKKAMDFAIAEWDRDQDGVMERDQFNTYDREIFGHNTFASSLYLAALRAAEVMAGLVNDTGAAQRYRKLFELGREKIARTLYDGEYYIQDVESAVTSRRVFEEERAKAAGKPPPIGVGEQEGLQGGYGKGCWADQVVGQWWARVLNLGDILPIEQVQSALKAIFKHNWLWKIEGFEGTQRFLEFADGPDKGLLCGSWPKGGRPNDPMHYRDECWTGVEYQVAAHKIYEGQVQEGLIIVRGARERYDGTKRSPWNEIECGDYYARALSSWSLLLAAQGYAYEGPAGRLTFNPRIDPDNHRSFFTTAEGWGRFEQQRTGKSQKVVITVSWGRCDLARLCLGLPATARSVTANAKLDDRDLFIETSVDKGMAVVSLTAPITVVAGNKLHLDLTWS